MCGFVGGTDDTILRGSFRTEVGPLEWVFRADYAKISGDGATNIDFDRSSVSDDDKRAGKARILAAMRTELQRLKTQSWNGYSGYDGWAQRANNATLGVQAAYDELVPAFEKLFEQQGRFGVSDLRLTAVLLPGLLAGLVTSKWVARVVDRGYTRRAVLAVATAAGYAGVG